VRRHRPPLLQSHAPQLPTQDRVRLGPFPQRQRNWQDSCARGFGILIRCRCSISTYVDWPTAPFYKLIATSKLDAGSFPSGAYTTVTTSGSASNTQFGALETPSQAQLCNAMEPQHPARNLRDLTATIGYVGTHGLHQPFVSMMPMWLHPRSPVRVTCGRR